MATVCLDLIQPLKVSIDIRRLTKVVKMVTIGVCELDLKPILDYRKDEKVIQAIRRCSSTPDNVIIREKSAKIPLANLKIFEGAVFEAICAWIDREGEINLTISQTEPFVGEHMYEIKSIEVEGAILYIKVKFWGDINREGGPRMILVSAHD